MPDSDRAHWNSRYAQTAYDFAPVAWLPPLADQIRPRRAGARALDLACGGGRNALFLARLGYAVDAWDISDVALDLLRAELGRLARAGESLAVEPRHLELEGAVLPADHYDLLLDAHYLDRAQFAAMEHSLRPGGVLIVHTFLAGSGGPARNPAHVLEPGELPRVFANLVIETYTEDQTAAEVHLVARRDVAGTTATGS